jgi:hypothetical protein
MKAHIRPDVPSTPEAVLEVFESEFALSAHCTMTALLTIFLQLDYEKTLKALLDDKSSLSWEALHVAAMAQEVCMPPCSRIW